MRKTRIPIPPGDVRFAREKTRPYAIHTTRNPAGSKLARRCKRALPGGSYGAGLRKMFAQRNRARRANRKRMVA